MTERPHIVSLLASATEILCALGLRNHLVGRSHECDYPESVSSLPALSYPKIDATLSSNAVDRGVRQIVRDRLSVYGLDVDAIERLRPDVIVTQDHCEVCAVSLADVTDALCRLTLNETRVCSLHPSTLDDVCSDFVRVAQAAGVEERSAKLVADFHSRLDAVRQATAAAKVRPRVALIEWLAPPMIAGGWMPEIAAIAGCEPVIVASATTFREVSWTDIRDAAPHMVIVMPCGFDIARTERELGDPVVARSLRSVDAVREGQCYLVDGNALFNRPGPRLADSAELLASLVHGDLPGIRVNGRVRHWR